MHASVALYRRPDSFDRSIGRVLRRYRLAATRYENSTQRVAKTRRATNVADEEKPSSGGEIQFLKHDKQKTLFF